MKKKRLSMVVLCIAVIAACVGIIYGLHYVKTSAKVENPFKVTASAEIIWEKDPETGENEKRLYLKNDVMNNSDSELYNTWYTVTLNKEAEPYLADGILEFKQDKTHLYTKAQAEKAGNKLNNQGKPVICGFSYNCKLLLTTEENLKTYSGLTPDGIYDAVKSVTVNIHWRGGSQKVTVPISITKD